MGHYLYDIGIDLVEFLILCNACINKRGAIGDHRIDSLPCCNLFLCTVGGSIAGGVSGITVGEHIQQHRPLTVLDKLLLALVGFNYGKRIVAVYWLGVTPAPILARILYAMVSPLVCPPMPYWLLKMLKMMGSPPL